MQKLSHSVGEIRYIINPDIDILIKAIHYLNHNIVNNSFPYLRTNKPISIDNANVWLEMQTICRQIRSVALNMNDEVVGAAYLNAGRGRHSHNSTLAVTVTPDYIENKIGYTLCKQLVDLSHSIGVNRIEDYPLVINTAAINMLKKLGFEKEGIMRKLFRFDDGTYSDCYYMVNFL